MSSKKLLIIGSVWPEPRSSAAGSRMLQLIQLFKEEHYHIIFASSCGKTENSANLLGIGVESKFIELNSSSFDDFIKELSPDVVMFDRFMTEEQFGWRVSEQVPDALKILDTEDLHFLRKGRIVAKKEQQDFDDSYLYNEIAKREIASIYRCDLSLIISEFEMELLQSKFSIPKHILLYLPFLLDGIKNVDVQQLPSFTNRQHFVTIGNFIHEPNFQAVLYLKTTIWPLIKKQLPKAEMHVYGAYSSQKVQQLNQEKERFFIKGFAEDVNIVMQKARLCLAPLLTGAGLKGKLIDAMQNGTPCVMSEIAAEGMFGNMPANGPITNDALAFAEFAVRLYQNEEEWKQFQVNGFSAVKERFSYVDFKSEFWNSLDNIISNLQAHRNSNFTGIMLQHHALQSTKFMSRWIELKNKKD
ncbi:MAG: glycosyltransferase [Bacteroidetes bacterium MedPE-SWsnd-G2]|nr:MAG: glycosyltransferase [Bacteroidetes bacterium MedPE-SWsnd-G2]